MQALQWESKIFSWIRHRTRPYGSSVNSRQWTEIEADWIKWAARWPRDQRNCIDGRFQGDRSLAGSVRRSSGVIWDTVGLIFTKARRENASWCHFPVLQRSIGVKNCNCYIITQTPPIKMLRLMKQWCIFVVIVQITTTLHSVHKRDIFTILVKTGVR